MSNIHLKSHTSNCILCFIIIDNIQTDGPIMNFAVPSCPMQFGLVSWNETVCVANHKLGKICVVESRMCCCCVPPCGRFLCVEHTVPMLSCAVCTAVASASLPWHPATWVCAPPLGSTQANHTHIWRGVDKRFQFAVRLISKISLFYLILSESRLSDPVLVPESWTFKLKLCASNCKHSSLNWVGHLRTFQWHSLLKLVTMKWRLISHNVRDLVKQCQPHIICWVLANFSALKLCVRQSANCLSEFVFFVLKVS